MNLIQLRRRLLISFVSLVFFTSFLMIAGCSDAPVSSGGGTRGGNPVVTGMIIGLDGHAAPDVKVTLIPSDYNPVTDTTLAVPSTVVTDSNGVFSIKAPDSGVYSIAAVNVHDGSRLLKFNIPTYKDSTSTLPTDTLHAPGLLKVIFSGGADGYLFVPGTNIKAFTTGGVDTITIDSIPATTLPALVAAVVAGSETKVVQNDIIVNPGEVTYVGSWESGGFISIILNTTQNGANVSGNIYNFPVLIRLNSTNCNFNQLQSNGADIHFSRKNIELPFEIERWDETAARAELWVKVDTIYGNDSTQSIVLHWGDGNDTPSEKSAAVFDTASGFQGVWHLDQAFSGQFIDATVNKYNGTSPDTSVPAKGNGIIGNCALFDGKTDFITMRNTADSKINFTENGYYTVCAWALLDTQDNQSHCIISKGFEQYYLRSTNISLTSMTTPLWEFVEFSDADKWQTLSTVASVKQWTFLVGVREGKKQYLYCNGTLVDTTVELWPNPATRTTSNDLYIGRFAKKASTPLEEGFFYFKGGIDEVRILNKAVNSDWIKLCYMNQRTDDHLVVFQK